MPPLGVFCEILCCDPPMSSSTSAVAEQICGNPKGSKWDFHAHAVSSFPFLEVP